MVRVSQPLLIGFVIRYFLQPNFEDPVTFATANWAVFGICTTLSKHQWLTSVQRYGMYAKSALTVLIYKKILRLSKSSFEKTSVGQILNMLANDLSRLDEISHTFCYLFVGPIQTVVVIIIMWQYLGVACLGGIVILLLFIPFQGMMGRLFSKFR